MKYIAYCRKSREEKDKQILSIQAQIAELKEYAKRDVINVREILLHRGHEHLYGQYVEITKSIIDFLEESENLNINDWVMFEENDIATIRLASEEYYVFAKHNSDSRFLLVKYGDRKIYHVEHEDLKPKLLKDNL